MTTTTTTTTSTTTTSFSHVSDPITDSPHQELRP